MEKLLGVGYLVYTRLLQLKAIVSFEARSYLRSFGEVALKKWLVERNSSLPAHTSYLSILLIAEKWHGARYAFTSLILSRGFVTSYMGLISLFSNFCEFFANLLLMSAQAGSWLTRP